jgi:small subunit ribosomal protein S15
MLKKEQKKGIIEKFRSSEKDTGSTKVQIALLTESIKKISKHLEKSKFDYSTKQGFLKMIGRRRRLLTYLKNKDVNSYKSLVKELDI